MFDMTKVKGDCFQIIGVDVFIDSQLKAWVLEVNDSPSLNINFNKEGGKGEGLITLPSEVDKHIKTLIVGEALKMMLKHKKSERYSLENYKCWLRLQTQEFSLSHFLKGAKLFQSLGHCEHITCSKFSKLGKKL